jgi:formate dehydrogenase subunit gamma
LEEAVSVDDKVLRFRACERHLHWAIAIPFKVCYLTALVLVVVYNPHPQRPLRELVSWIHRLSGVCLATLPPAMIAWHWREFRLHLENIRAAWSWSARDFKWLLLMGPATLSSRVTLPEQGKFNAAEKINFMSLMLTYPVYVMTGATIWFLAPAYLAWLIHFSMALAATPLVLGHVFMATVNPSTRAGLPGMVTGWVDRHWASHHYALWYRQHHAAPAVRPRTPEPVVYLPARPCVPEVVVSPAVMEPAAATASPRVAAGPVLPARVPAAAAVLPRVPAAAAVPPRVSPAARPASPAVNPASVFAS